MKNLKLERPLVFIDIESTGNKKYQDRIVELTILTVNPDGTESCWTQRINPEIPIPPAATKIHGITDDDVKDKPKFRECMHIISELLVHGSIAGFNIKNFDLPLLEAEFRRNGVEFSCRNYRILDSMTIYHQKEPRDLAAAYLKYCSKELVNSHNSEADARASREVLDCQLGEYSDLPTDINGLHDFCNQLEEKQIENWIDRDGKFVWKDGEAILGFGKHEGRKLKEMATAEPGYLKWIINSDFSIEVKDIATKALRGDFPVFPA